MPFPKTVVKIYRTVLLFPDPETRLFQRNEPDNPKENRSRRLEQIISRLNNFRFINLCISGGKISPQITNFDLLLFIMKSYTKYMTLK